jgi:hypothetical protein
MRADPVHLKVHGDHLVLADATRLALTEAEAGLCVSALNGHFGAEGMHFVAPHPLRWYVRLDDDPRMHAAPTSDAAGRNIDAFLPGGAAGARWRRVLNEAQMLMHDLPFNRERSARGLLPLNSIWLWGAGRAAAPAAPQDAIWADDPIASGLGRCSGVPTRTVPSSYQEWSGELRSASPLLVLDRLPSTAYGDAAAWRDAVAVLERDWFAPLAARLAHTAADSLVLHGLGRDFYLSVCCRRGDRFRFWRRPRPLHAYAA